MKTKYAALLMFGGLFNPVRSVSAAGSSENITDLCHQITPTTVNPFFNSNDHISQNITPLVDKKFMQNFIAGSPNECLAITQLLAKMRQVNSELANYIDLAFTHLEGLSIATYAAADFKNQTGHLAVYYSTTKTICLPDHVDNNDFAIMAAVRHEIRHAAMNAAQQVLSGTKTPSTNCFFPDTEEERIKVANIIKEGDENVIALKKLLQLESKKLISKEEQQTLNQLREACQNEYHNYYQIFLENSLTEEKISEYEKIMGKKFLVGQTINFGHAGGLDADVTIKSIKPSTTTPSEKEIFYSYNDPLKAAVYHIPIEKAHAKKLSSGDRYLYERDAYLHGSFPQAIIQYLYPNFYKYTSALINKARQIPVLYNKQLLGYQSLQKMIFIEILDILQNPERFEVEAVDSFIPWAIHAIAAGKPEAAKIGLTTLIQKGHHKGEANRLLARMAYQSKDYLLASKHYKRAEKNNALFSRFDRASYGNSLQETKQYQSALKQFKKLKPKIDDSESTIPKSSPQLGR